VEHNGNNNVRNSIVSIALILNRAPKGRADAEVVFIDLRVRPLCSPGKFCGARINKLENSSEFRGERVLKPDGRRSIRR
jgi:hypothetical protein